MRSPSGIGDRQATLTLFAGIAVANVALVATLFMLTREWRDAV